MERLALINVPALAVHCVPYLELCDALAPERIWKESRVAHDLTPILSAPAHILAPLRAPGSLAEECRIHSGGINGNEATRCDELCGKVHQEEQLFVVQEEREEVTSRNDKSRTPLKARRWRPVKKFDFQELRGWNALASEGDRLRVPIDADQASITGVERLEDSTCATTELNDGAVRCLSERAPERTIILRASVEVTLVVEESTPRR